MTNTTYKLLVPPLAGVAYSHEIVLWQYADPKLIQTSPTLAAGDFLVFKDGILDGNIDALPAEIASGALVLTLSIAEMTGVTGRVFVKWHDVAGQQWIDGGIQIDLAAGVAVGTSDLIQADILSDATPFAGANVANLNAAISSRAVPGDAMTLSNGAITAAVIATGAIDADAIADGAIDAGAIADNAITAAKIADGAIDAATFVAGAINAAAIATGAIDADALATDASTEIATSVWGGAGYTGGRPLTQASTSTADTSSTGAIRRTRGDSWTITITDLPTLTGYTSIWFTLKDKKSQVDSESRLQIKKNATGLSDGLLYVNGAEASDSTKGSITVASTTSITIAVDPTITDDMPADWLGYYDVQTLISTADNTPEAGAFEVTADVTRAIA